MPDGDSSDGGETDGDSTDQRIYHRTVEPETERANERVLGHIAELEGCELTDMPPLYDRIDDLLRNIFDSPPPSEAELEFSYYGYRITIDQTGRVSLMKLPERSPTEADEE
jgi:hypothetical protein